MAMSTSFLLGAGFGTLSGMLWMKLFLLWVALALAALSCGPRAVREASVSPGSPGDGGKAVGTRFLLGGWIVPKDRDVESDPFAETLEAFVITSGDEMRDFLEGLDFIRLRGNLEAVDRTDFDEMVVVAAYYLWRPLKGDPLSLERVTVDGSEVKVSLEMEQDPQGRERPFLMAPLYITALEREDLPDKTSLEFVFLINGEESAKRTLIPQ